MVFAAYLTLRRKKKVRLANAGDQGGIRRFALDDVEPREIS